MDSLHINNSAKVETKITKMSYGKMPCLDPNHNAPTLIYIPPGNVLEHVCPSCGWETRIEASNITC